MEKKTALAIGAFDGLHRGHTKLVKIALSQKGLEPAVLSFRENPSADLIGKTAYIITQEEKEEILKNMGIEKLFILDFCDIKNLSAKDFFYEYIVKKCGAKKIICGENFRFGKKASGNIELLESLCKQNDMELIVADYECFDNEIISSTRIRKAVENGEMKIAKSMLGRDFGFNSVVIKGNQIGRTIGTPTINQIIPKGFVLPKFGVYASCVTVEGRELCGLTNVGVKPSIGKYEPNCETWILDFEKDMYGMKIKVELIEFIREEKKFDSLDKLREEIGKDAEKAKNIFEKTIYKSE
ncbi:MAG: bifunctional riboflavin kinase/FAD synthetase [Clostridia bacterium]